MALKRQFRELVNSSEILVLPGAYDALSAKLIETAGFNAAFMTGFGHSASKLGSPDVGLMTLSEMADRARDTANAINIPLVVDGDTGFGNNINVVRTVREYERTGAVAIQLEDQTMPKKCGHMLGREIVSEHEMVNKIRAAISARSDSDFLIIARTDARTNYGIDEALRRAKIYEDAGADIIFVESLETVEEMELVNKTISVPTVANMVEGGRSPYLTANQLEQIGYSIVYFPVAPIFAASQAVLNVLENIKDFGNAKKAIEDGSLIDFKDFNNFIGLAEIREIESNDFSHIGKQAY